ncbi:DNA polymerase I [Brochothrix campestris FSL F6-1037]|uniref:5'-3' exonuclease n=1 Tax=Brochothrix campestris FSL F6-1037 TaxID=1265861 RepID=W7CUK3_9LIST|nr:DNA polymerase I [Brochothrix campestris FSL F6-1037]
MKKLVLFDGNSLAYRAFFALPLLNNDKGVYTNAVYGFAMMLTNVMKKEQPTHVMVAFDAGKTTFRHAQYQDYKGGRSKTPSELGEQFPFIKELLEAYQVKHYQLPNYEADDIIGTLAQQAERDGFDEVLIITGDRDLTQLASDKITVNITKKGITEVEANTPASLREKYDLTPQQIIDLKGLMGDSSDNIPGVKGVGEKTALKLLHQYDTVENVLAHIDDVSGKKLKENLTTYREDAIMSKALVTIKVDTPIEITLDEIAYSGYEPNDVIPTLRELGFKALLEKELGDQPEAKKEPLATLVVETVSDIPVEQLTTGMAVYAETKTDNYLASACLGWSFYNGETVYYMSHEAVLASIAVTQFLTDASLSKKSI